ncbi:DUF6470 family protein [Paenibacillus humicola]|uniref:DUF6470 family protein n=1 Tax=Paenibacillus humicola TaxID=3110540 RepID=UPI00237A3F6C|nr:DUF6470 family protein [Paenibacillus humicola]
MNDFRLSIRQTYAQIGIETHQASQDMHAPLGDQSIEQPQAKLEIRQPTGVLTIDSSAAWTGLGQGPHLEWLNSIYSQEKTIILQVIAKTVEDGNRMAQITNPQDAFADIAGNVLPLEPSPIQYVGEASSLNVKIDYQPREPEIEAVPQYPRIRYIPRKPEIQTNPGAVDIYLKQRNSIDIQVSRYNLYQ